MKFKRFLKKLAIGFALAAGFYVGVDKLAPPSQLTEVFNNAAAIPEQQAKEYRVAGLEAPTAEEAKDLWRVRVGAWSIGLGGYHTFLEFSPYDQNDPAKMGEKNIYQLHGIACDEVRHTWALLDYKNPDSFSQYFNGDYILKGMGSNEDHRRKYFQDPAVAFVDVFYGTKEEVLKKYLDGMEIIKTINDANNPYILTAHNSNSTQQTLRKALGLPEPEMFVDNRLMAVAGRLWTPGINKSLLPDGWKAEEVRAKADYKDFTAEQLEARARAVSGSDKMFATFRTPPPQPPKPGA